MERQAIFISKIISDEIELPSTEEMMTSFELDVLKCKEERRMYFRPSFELGHEMIEGMQ